MFDYQRVSPRGEASPFTQKHFFFFVKLSEVQMIFLIAMGIIGTILHERARSWFHEQGSERAERVGNAGCFAETVYSRPSFDQCFDVRDDIPPKILVRPCICCESLVS